MRIHPRGGHARPYTPPIVRSPSRPSAEVLLTKVIVAVWGPEEPSARWLSTALEIPPVNGHSQLLRFNSHTMLSSQPFHLALVCIAMLLAVQRVDTPLRDECNAHRLAPKPWPCHNLEYLAGRSHRADSQRGRCLRATRYHSNIFPSFCV